MVLLPPVFVAAVRSTRIKFFPLVSYIHLRFAEYSLQFVRSQEDIYIHDPRSMCTIGDVALIEGLKGKKAVMPDLRQLPGDEELSKREIYHVLSKIIFKVGHTIDPLTGRRCTGQQYLTEKPSTPIPEHVSDPMVIRDLVFTPPSRALPWPFQDVNIDEKNTKK